MSGGQDMIWWKCQEHGDSFPEDEGCPLCAKEKKLRLDIARDFANGMPWNMLTTKYDLTSEDIEIKLRKFIQHLTNILDRSRK